MNIIRKIAWNTLGRYNMLENNVIRILLLPIMIVLGTLLSIVCWIVFLLTYVPKYGFKDGWRIQLEDQFKWMANNI